MRDLEFNRVKAKLKHMSLHWIWTLGLKRWHRIDIVYHRSDPNPKEADGYACPAWVNVKWEYQIATVNFDVSQLLESSDEELEYIVIHELCHVLVNEMRCQDGARQHEERVVTGLAQAFRWVRNVARDEALKKRRKK